MCESTVFIQIVNGNDPYRSRTKKADTVMTAALPGNLNSSRRIGLNKTPTDSRSPQFSKNGIKNGEIPV